MESNSYTSTLPARPDTRISESKLRVFHLVSARLSVNFGTVQPNNGGGGEFSVSKSPVAAARIADSASGLATEMVAELPQSYGQPLLVAVARDPHTLFAYWDIDWATVFAGTPPVDRTVRLRVLAEDGAEESAQAVEPMAGSAYVGVSVADATYTLELGYEQPAGHWNSVLKSASATTPRDGVVTEDAEFHLATIPLHLSFQRLLDVFRCPQFDGRSLSSAIGASQVHWREQTPSAAPIGDGFEEEPTAGTLSDRAELQAQARAPGALRQQLTRAMHAQSCWSGSSSGN